MLRASEKLDAICPVSLTDHRHALDRFSLDATLREFGTAPLPSYLPHLAKNPKRHNRCPSVREGSCRNEMSSNQ